MNLKLNFQVPKRVKRSSHFKEMYMANRNTTITHNTTNLLSQESEVERKRKRRSPPSRLTPQDVTEKNKYDTQNNKVAYAMNIALNENIKIMVMDHIEGKLFILLFVHVTSPQVLPCSVILSFYYVWFLLNPRLKRTGSYKFGVVIFRWLVSEWASESVSELVS